MLSSRSGYWSTWFHVSLEAVASVTTLEGGFNLLGGVYQGMTAAGEAGAAGAAGEAGAAGGEAGSATGPAAGEPGAAGGEAGSANGPAAGEAGAAEGSGLKPPKQCFPAGTPVHTSVSLKAIDQVAVGDRVWAYDHRQLRWAEREVVEVYQLVHQGPMATVQVRGELLRATDGHPFWVVRGERLAERPLPVRIKAYEASRRQEGRWVLARDLRAGDEVLLRHREVAALESVRLDEVEERVYNFHVAELQNYAVGGWGVLVHNTNEGPTGTGPEPTSPAPGRLTPEQVRVVENARQIARGDCEQAAEVFRETLPGGTKQRFAGDRLLHEVYQHQGTVYDVTTKQYVRPGVWTPEELARAGLTDAVESGVFTPQQHQTFMQKVIQVFGGVQD